MIQAIGFHANEIPVFTRAGKKLNFNFNDKTGGFQDEEGEVVKGLYGAGIAWPEKVTDPEGNVEHAVGLAKFMNFLKRVTPTWTSA